MAIGRRDFLRRFGQAVGGASIAPSLSGLALWNGVTPDQARRAFHASEMRLDYGPLVRSTTCPELEIPEHFQVKRISVARAPSTVRESLVVPNAFDGMATFPMQNGNIRLIRNHELTDSATRARPLASPAYDNKASGGTTSLEVKISGTGEALQIDLVDEFVSLAGTRVNCAGGRTPWGSWLTCEETTSGTTAGFEKAHGYIFEVPAAATGPVTPVPLRAMGRFVHEAVAVDPNTGYVYETEDTYYSEEDPRLPGAGLYRFIPTRRDVLTEGGRLQMMAIEGQRNFLTARRVRPGTTLPVTWVDIEDPDPANAEADQLAVFREGVSKGAAIFARLEGAFWGDDGAYIVSTSGGDARAGQVFHYKPKDNTITLVFESPSRDVMEGPDNLCIAPNGALVLCEDSSGDQYVRVIDRAGNVANLVRHGQVQGGPQPGEFCGACFSPDMRVLFFNVQGSRNQTGTTASATYALWGPWPTTR